MFKNRTVLNEPRLEIMSSVLKYHHDWLLKLGKICLNKQLVFYDLKIIYLKHNYKTCFAVWKAFIIHHKLDIFISSIM